MIPKYRAWNKESKEMYACYGFNTFDTKNKLFICSKPNSSFKNGKLQTIHEVEVFADDYILMQYTGLKDRNGAEVYFNDIVEDEYGHRYEVVFEGDCLRCNGVRKIRGGHKPKNRWFGRGLKIIGNIYENPELLEVEE